MTTTNPTPAQQGETLEGCPFCPAELTPLPSAHLPADLHEQASEWYQITHNVGCYFLLLGFGDYPIHRDRLKAWNTRRAAVAGPRSDVLAELFDLFEKDKRGRWCFKSLSRDDTKFDSIMDRLAAATASPAPAESDSCSHWREGDSDNCPLCGDDLGPTSEIDVATPAERTRVEGERNTIRDEQVIANLQMRLKRAELIPSERQHLLALLMKERESGDYQGNQARYYQVRDRLIKRLSQE